MGSIIVYFRYLAQTPFIVDGERIRNSSVQEVICGPLVKLFGARETRFLASGREDVDVRMLGDGKLP